MAPRQKASKEEMLALREKEKLSNKEIAERLGISYRTVHTRIGAQPKELTSKKPSETTSKPAKTVSKPSETPVKPVEVKTPTPAPKPAPKPIPAPPKPILAAIPTRFFDFTFAANWPEQLKTLSLLASPESWQFINPPVERKYPETEILENHILITFKRRAEEYNTRLDVDPDRIIYIRDKICFYHTGLYTAEGRSIYAYFEPYVGTYARQDWFFKSFKAEHDPVFNGISVRPEHRELEQRVHNIFNPNLEIRINAEHMLASDENINRLPEFMRGVWNANLQLETAVEFARRRAVVMPYSVITSVHAGYITYYLPLFITNSYKPDAVLVLNDRAGFYEGRTILTPEQAYLTLRVSRGKPVETWLTDLLVPIKPK